MRVSKEAKRRALSRRTRWLFGFLLKSKLQLNLKYFAIRLLNEISESLKKYDRKPRQAGRGRSREWWDRNPNVQEMDNREFRQNFRVSCEAFQKRCERLVLLSTSKKLSRWTPFLHHEDLPQYFIISAKGWTSSYKCYTFILEYPPG